MRRPTEEYVTFARAHTPALFRRAVLLSGNRHTAEDLVQETLARLYLHWDRIDAEDNPAGYAQTTLVHLFISTRRRRWIRERPVEVLPERGESSTVEQADLRLDLVRALRELSPRERCVVLARYVDDRSVADVAAMVNRSEAWVRTTAHRALARLRTTQTLLVDPVA